MSDESHWIERAQSAEARIKTMEDAFRPALDRVKEFKTNFGIREQSDGALVIDFDAFVENLGEEACHELQSVIEEKYPVKLRAVK